MKENNLKPSIGNPDPTPTVEFETFFKCIESSSSTGAKVLSKDDFDDRLKEAILEVTCYSY